MVKILLTAGADPAKSNQFGKSALTYAGSNFELVKLLKEAIKAREADVDSLTTTEITAEENQEMVNNQEKSADDNAGIE